MIFSYESKISQSLIKLCYSCWLNILWVVCSIPVFTMGAATTALYDVSLKIVRDEETSLTRQFFKSFRSNFRQATVLWMILFGIGLLLVGDGWVLWHLRASSTGAVAIMWTLLLAVLIVASIAYVIVLLYVFPVVASVSNTNRAMLKNSFLIGIHYLFATILVFAIHFAMFYVVVAVFTPMAIFGEGLVTLLSAWLLNNVLRAVSYNPNDAQDGDDA